MKAVFTALSPNLQFDDVKLAARLALSFGAWVNGEAESKLESVMRSLTRLPYAVAFASGRSALFAALRASGVQPGDEVLMQAYTCVAVPDAVLWTGALPKYVDIEDDYLMSAHDLRKKITHRSRVLIVQHTFTLRSRAAELIKIGRDNRLVVIEDCAHTLGSVLSTGQQAGTAGDIGIFSFGRDKVISSVFGGIAITSLKGYADNLFAQQKKLLPAPRTWIFQQLMHPLLTWAIRLTYDLVVGRIILAVARALRFLSRPVEAGEKRGLPPIFLRYRLPNALAVLAIHQLRKLKLFQAHRESLTRYYDNIVFPNSVRKPILNESDPAFLRYPLQVTNARQILSAAARDKLFLGDWYQQSIAPGGVEYSKMAYEPVSCPRAEYISRKSLNLPTHIGISEGEASMIVQWLLTHI